jgi:hypothetical protein
MEPLVEKIRRIPLEARMDLLRVLTSTADVRADLIRQMHERHLDLAEVLMDLEGDARLRERVIEVLRAGT